MATMATSFRTVCLLGLCQSAGRIYFLVIRNIRKYFLPPLMASNIHPDNEVPGSSGWRSKRKKRNSDDVKEIIVISDDSDQEMPKHIDTYIEIPDVENKLSINDCDIVGSPRKIQNVKDEKPLINDEKPFVNDKKLFINDGKPFVSDVKPSIQDEEEIPAFTVTNITNTKAVELMIEKHGAERHARLFIGHLLDHDRIKRSKQKLKHFVVEKMVFRSITVMGIVVGMYTTSFAEKSRTVICVDDGTGVLDCYLEDREYINKIEDRISYLTNEGVPELNDPNSVDQKLIYRAALMALQSARVMLKEVPRTNNVKQGDIVEIVGNFREYFGKRCCFINKIKRYPEGTTITEHLEQLHDLYRGLYKELYGFTF